MPGAAPRPRAGRGAGGAAGGSRRAAKPKAAAAAATDAAGGGEAGSGGDSDGPAASGAAAGPSRSLSFSRSEQARGGEARPKLKRLKGSKEEVEDQMGAFIKARCRACVPRVPFVENFFVCRFSGA